MDIIRQMKSLTGIGVSREEKLAPPEEFWKKYDAGEFAKPITTYNDPAFKQWEQEVAKLSAQEQIKAVVKKLQELNPEFDGNVTPQFDGQTVVGLQLSSDHVTDISPVRALRQLTSLSCATSNVYARAPLADLGPLAGMKLKSLVCYTTSVRDLSPLVGMPLEKLDCGGAFVTDLKPLRGMPLGELYLGGSTELTDLKPLAGMKLSVLSCYVTKVADLAPLAGMPLKALMFYDTPVTDLAPLERMALETAVLTPAKIRRGIGILRGMPSLHTIGIDYATRFPAVEFWKKYDAGEFGKPATAP
jgi:Leucine-rich repeat (LRR) protein